MLKKSPEIKYDEVKFSKLSQDLINKLVNFETKKRYSVYQALKHPWITRCNESDIPETFDDVIKKLEAEERLRKAMSVCFACSVVKTQYNSETPRKDTKYVRLLDKVTKAIDKWQQRKEKRDFINDEDFVERQGSPNKFDSISDFSQTFREYETYERKNNSEISSPRGLSDNKS